MLLIRKIIIFMNNNDFHEQRAHFIADFDINSSMTEFLSNRNQSIDLFCLIGISLMKKLNKYMNLLAKEEKMKF